MLALDYGFRIYNPAIGKFLSVDPLTQSYPMLTPYQFAGNRPIDGIDLDGREYLNYIINWYEGQTEPEINISWFDPKQKNNHDYKGRGVQYVINHWNKTSSGSGIELDKVKSSSFYYERDFPLFEYGLYYGATSLFKLSKDGAITRNTDYGIRPVDAVDYGAWKHDQGYGKVRASGASGLLLDWATTPADDEAIIAWKEVVNLGIGAKDPIYSDQKITKAQYNAANRGIKGFSLVVQNKKMEIAAFMIGNSQADSNNLDEIYRVFLETYFEIDKKGFYVKRDDYWKEGSGSKPIPLDKIENNTNVQP